MNRLLGLWRRVTHHPPRCIVCPRHAVSHLGSIHWCTLHTPTWFR